MHQRFMNVGARESMQTMCPGHSRRPSGIGSSGHEKCWEAVVGWHFNLGTKHFDLGLAVDLVAASDL